MSVQFKNQADLGGLITNIPEDKIPERNASDIADMDLSIYGFIQTRKGHDRFGNTITDPGACLRSFPFKKNYGNLIDIIIRQRDNGTTAILEWWNPNNTLNNADGYWETLVTGLQTGAPMGFAIANGDEGTKINRLVFCNGYQNVSYWNGATATYVSPTANTIVCDDLALQGFTATGSLLINGVTYAYTGISSNTFTGVTPDPTAGSLIAGMGVAQLPDTSTYSSLAKGNILCTSQAKLFISGETQNESKVHYSKTGDVLDFTITAGLGGGGTFDVIEKGGAITYMEPKGQDTVIIHKTDSIVAYKRSTDGTNAIENFETLAYGADSGAVGIKAGTVLNRDSYFCTGKEGLKLLSKAIDDSSLNVNSITDAILPSLENYNFSDAAVIYYPRKRAIYLACKSSSSVSGNDKVIVYYTKRGPNGNYIGDLSIHNLSVADWFIYNSNLYYVSSIDQNAYVMYSRRSDRGTGINHKWVSKEFTNDEPGRGKEFNTMYIDGFIGDRTKIKITILYGILGTGGEKSQILSWNDTDYVSSQKISALGTDILGTLSLGASSIEITDSYSFSAPIHFDVLKSNRYKVKIETIYDDDTDVESYWAVSNIGFNPNLMERDFNKMINSNS